jgi:hypothetical protein
MTNRVSLAHPTWCLFLLAGALVLGTAGASDAVPTFHVANNGVDTATCGTTASPCRSISQALARAALPSPTPSRLRPKIVVGPGRYGDLNADGDLDDPGEEFSGAGSDCTCMILVDFPVEIVSTDGALTTLIAAPPSPVGGPSDAVALTSPGIVFGRTKKGFTVTADLVTPPEHNPSGLIVRGGPMVPGLPGALVEGNLVVHQGFLVADGPDDAISVSQASASVQKNVVVGWSVGLRGNGSVDQVAPVLSRNVVVGNESGAVGSRAELSRNAIAANALALGSTFFPDIFPGVFPASPAIVTENWLVGSGESGGVVFVSLLGDAAVLSNAIIGNRKWGVGVSEFSPPSPVQRNNIFGNGSSPVDPTLASFMNCGLVYYDVSSAAHPLNASPNYWGGPGTGADPADTACVVGTVGPFTTMPETPTPYAIPAPVSFW